MGQPLGSLRFVGFLTGAFWPLPLAYFLYSQKCPGGAEPGQDKREDNSRSNKNKIRINIRIRTKGRITEVVIKNIIRINSSTYRILFSFAEGPTKKE